MIDSYFSPEALRVLRQEIKNTGGAEVFALGSFDGDRVQEVEILGRGNFDSVPVVNRGLGPGQVVIHNHPSGNLHPSAADIQVASRMEQYSVGFMIVNNSVDRIYVVVEPLPSRELDLGEITSYFQPGGALDNHFSAYEHRPEQLEMRLQRPLTTPGTFW